jgi:putative spermidine/putrescine transport system ATP-binding protein
MEVTEQQGSSASEQAASAAKPLPGLEVHHLCKSFHGVDVVTDVNLTIENGEFVTLLGPSGSGKTTTLNMVAGFLIPDKGQIFIGGQELSRVPPENRGLGMVFQSYALFPHMTVFENIAFPLKRRKIKGQELKTRVDRALADVELTPRAQAKPSELSGGQQQRAALARALVFEPSLILFDEPLGALDRRLRERLQVQLREMHDRLGFTALYVTHDQEEALNLSDRIGIMNEAKLAQVGACEEIYRRPRSAFVAKFLGDANMVECTVIECADRCTVRINDSQVVVSAGCSDELQVTKDSKALLVARPEALHVTAQGEAGESRLLSGHLTDRVFLGQDVVSTVTTEQGTRLTVRERPEGAVSRLSVGDPTDVMWRTYESAIVVPASEVVEAE